MYSSYSWSCSCSCLSIYLFICKLESEAILRDFLYVLTWQHRKRSKSPRFPECSNLTTSKMQQFCEDFPQKWKVECRADGLVSTSQEISTLTSWHLWWTCLLYCVCHAHCIFADPQRRALFWQVNFEKRSDTEVLYAFWLQNLLRATTTCTFSTSQFLPREPGTWKTAGPVKTAGVLQQKQGS